MIYLFGVIDITAVVFTFLMIKTHLSVWESYTNGVKWQMLRAQVCIMIIVGSLLLIDINNLIEGIEYTVKFDIFFRGLLRLAGLGLAIEAYRVHKKMALK